jgi:hypothetical protein
VKSTCKADFTYSTSAENKARFGDYFSKSKWINSSLTDSLHPGGEFPFRFSFGVARMALQEHGGDPRGARRQFDEGLSSSEYNREY